MVRSLKHFFYFPIANYFRLFATIQLYIWKPRIIVVTGSTGKTSLLHLVKSQLEDEAIYSHNANSAFGISFHILGLNRKDLTAGEWFRLFLLAPLAAFKTPPTQKLYVVEADCDRPGEGDFLSSMLKPEVTIWLSCSRSHSMNFDRLVSNGEFTTVDEAIAHEFGFLARRASSLVIANWDSVLIKEQLKDVKAQVKLITRSKKDKYILTRKGTTFKINEEAYSIDWLMPEDNLYSVKAVIALTAYLQFKVDKTFPNFTLAPGRSSIFAGLKGITIIDSSYNATTEGMNSMLQLFTSYPTNKRWAVIGDILELGLEEKEEHESLATAIATVGPEKVILVGPRVSKYTYPKLTKLMDATKIENFLMPLDVLTYLENNLDGGETIMFKGARFLEGVIEKLLSDSGDIQKLCRREKIWQKRRKQWQL